MGQVDSFRLTILLTVGAVWDFELFIKTKIMEYFSVILVQYFSFQFQFFRKIYFNILRIHGEELKKRFRKYVFKYLFQQKTVGEF